MRALDRHAIERFGMPGYELMTRAGHAALDALRARWPDARSLSVLCGPGNNGGDGYVLARVARAQGLRTSVVALGDAAALTGRCASCLGRLRRRGRRVRAMARAGAATAPT